MTPEPLDPCPVCGGPLVTGSGHGVFHSAATMVGEMWPCWYAVKIEHHRRLCAEVALARVVIEQDTRRQPEFVRHAGPFDADRGARLIEEAIARVREASK